MLFLKNGIYVFQRTMGIRNRSAVSKKDEVQDKNINQLKLEVYDTHRKDEKITTNFQPADVGDVINQPYLDEKISKINGHLSSLVKDCSDFKLQYNKQSVEKNLFQRAVKTTNQILYDKGLFDSFPDADNILKEFLFVKRRRSDLEKVNYDVVQ